MVLGGFVQVQLYVYGEYGRGLSTQPCGEPVLRVKMELGRKSLTQMHIWDELTV